MALRQAWFFNDDANDDGSDYFIVPDDCNVIWITGCGGGGAGVSGRTQYNGVGGNGGSASPAFVRYPISVTPGGVVVVHVGRGAAGNPPQSNGNAAIGTTDASNYNLGSVIAGDITGPEIAADIPYFALGWSESQTGPMLPARGFSAGSGLFPFIHIKWSATSSCAVFAFMGPFSSGEDGAATYSNSLAASSTYGLYALNDKRTGLGGTWDVEDGSGCAGGQCGGDFAAGGTKELGGGGAGGASAFGAGGNGGSGTTDSGNGGDGSGYGSGGGGGAGGRSTGGDGGWGFVLLEY